MLTDDLLADPANRRGLDIFQSWIHTKRDGLLYHYTSLDAAVAITQTKVLWASEARYLNDPTEQRYAYDLMAQVLDEECQTYAAEIQIILRMLPERIRVALDNLYAFLVSFSEHGDLLSQWVAYTPSCRGVALGIMPDVLARNEFTLLRVVYDLQAQRDVLRSILRHYFDELVQVIASGDSSRIAPLTLGLAALLEYALMAIKNPAYAAEAEWRSVILLPRFLPHRVPLRHRSAARAVVPYVELEIRVPHGGDLAVRDLVVGPALEFENARVGIDSLFRVTTVPPLACRPSHVPYRDPR